MKAVGNLQPPPKRRQVFQGAVELWETRFGVFRNSTAPAAFTASSHPDLSPLFSTSFPLSATGTRRHKEIFGHQCGGPILKVETPALTERRAYVFDRDSAGPFPTGAFPLAMALGDVAGTV